MSTVARSDHRSHDGAPDGGTAWDRTAALAARTVAAPAAWIFATDDAASRLLGAHNPRRLPQPDPLEANAVTERNHDPAGPETRCRTIPLNAPDDRRIGLLIIDALPSPPWTDGRHEALLEIAALAGRLLSAELENAGLRRAAAELRRVETELQHKSQDLHLALLSARMGTWTRELNPDSVQWSPELERIFGLEPGGFTGDEAAFWDFVHPDDRPRAASAVVQAIETGTDYEIEFRHRLPSGEERWMVGRGRASYDADGRPVRLAGIGMDVTERKHALIALDRYRLLSEHGRDIILFIRRSDGRILEANAAAAAAYGFDRNVLTTLTIGQLRAPETHHELDDQFARADVSGILFRTAHRRRDGSIFPVEVSARGAELHGERVVLSIIRDVTDREIIERTLRENAEFYRAVFNQEAVAITTTAPDGRLLSANTAFLRLLGYGPNDVTRLSIRDITHPDDIAADLEQAARVAAGDIPRYDLEKRMLRRDGTVVRVSVSACGVHDATGNPLYGISFIRDVTEQRRMAESLDRTRERLTLSLQASGSGAWDWDVAADDLYWSPEYRLVFGIAPDAEPSFDAWIAAIHPEDRDSIRSRALDVMSSGGPWREEYRILNPHLGQRWVANWGKVTCDARGRPIRFTGIVRDITERKNLEAELRERTERLAEDDRRKNEFLAMLAHELRNPLASISTAARLLGNTEDVADMAWGRDVIERQVRHLSRLIDDLLDVARITRGKIELKPEPTDVGPIVARAVESVRSMIDAKGHRLDVSVGPGPLRVHADPTRFVQILENLLTNAAKYTDEGGRIGIDAGRTGDTLEIVVTDDGIGIPTEMLPRVFDLFTQVDRSLDRAQGGLGIGLGLVRRLAEMHGGTIAAHSEGPGRGSVFTLRMPAYDGPEPEDDVARLAPTRPPAYGPSRRILIVDDIDDVARGLAKWLARAGHRTATAADGPSALAVAREFRPDVVVLDIGLPGMNGYEVAEALRALPETTGAILVAASGYGRREDRERADASGFDYHMTKPVDPDILLARVAEAARD